MNPLHAARQLPRRLCRWSRTDWLTPLACALISPSISAQGSEDDVLLIQNGDRLTGEVRRLDRGRLSFNTDATGTISVEWDEVGYLTSNQRFEIEVQSGAIFLGSLLGSEESRQLRIQTASQVIDIPTDQVVLMTPIEETLLDQIDIDVTMGYNFTKASELSQLNLGIDAVWRRERNGLNLSFDTVMTDEVDSSKRRQNLNISYDRFFDNRWVTRGLMSFERNDQLGIDLRSNIGAARGRFLRQTNQQRLAVYGGVVLSREEVDGTNAPPDAQLTEDSVEALGAIQAEWFRYDEPELDVSTSLVVYPSLSESGRVRTDLDVNVRWEIINDLFWQLTVYHSYDNEPRNVEADEADYGIITSIGWEF